MLKDIINKESLEEIIESAHLKNNHRGINEVYNELKNKYFYQNIKDEITEYINNCETCILEKYERKPPIPPLKCSETPDRPNKIIHLDVFYSIKKTLFITMIDKFSKVAMFSKIENRSEKEFRRVIMKFISVYGKIKKIVTDNELGMKSKLMKSFLSENDIQIHYTSNSNHNSNADIERLHNTINEHLRLLKHKKGNLSIEEQMILINGFYNNTIHSTTGKKPIDFIQGKIKEEEYEEIYNRVLQKKMKNIEKVNINRKEGKIDAGINYIQEIRRGKNHSKLSRIIDTEFAQDNEHIKDKETGHKYYKTHVRKKRKFQNIEEAARCKIKESEKQRQHKSRMKNLVSQ